MVISGVAMQVHGSRSYDPGSRHDRGVDAGERCGRWPARWPIWMHGCAAWTPSVGIDLTDPHIVVVGLAGNVPSNRTVAQLDHNHSIRRRDVAGPLAKIGLVPG